MNSSTETHRACPWCGEPYVRFIDHGKVTNGSEPLPADVCESGLGFWVHSE